VCHWGGARDGSTFRWWLRELRNLGYDVECLFLNSMFFPPTPQSRDRIYIVFTRIGAAVPKVLRVVSPAAVCPECGTDASKSAISNRASSRRDSYTTWADIVDAQ